MSPNVTFDSALRAASLELLPACGSAWWLQEAFSHTRDRGCTRGDGSAVTRGGCCAGWWWPRPLHKEIPSWLGGRGDTASLDLVGPRSERRGSGETLTPCLPTPLLCGLGQVVSSEASEVPSVKWAQWGLLPVGSLGFYFWDLGREESSG